MSAETEAISTNSILATSDATTPSAQRFAEALGQPALVFDGDGRLVFANSAGMGVLDSVESRSAIEHTLQNECTLPTSSDALPIHRISVGTHTISVLDRKAPVALSQQRSLTDLFDRVGLSIAIYDRSLHIRYFSKAAEEYTGVQNPCGKRLTEVFDVRPDVVQFYLNAIESGKRSTVTALQTIDRRLPKLLNITVLPVGDELLAVYENSEYVEQQRIADERNAARFRDLGDSLTVALFIVNPEQRITFWNRKAHALTGLSAKDALGRPAREVFPFIERELTSGLISALNSQRSYSKDRIPYDYRHISGYFNVKAFPVGDELAVLIEDVTEDVRAEELLRSNKERFRAMSDNLSIAFVLVNGDRQVTFWNKACEIASGISSAEALGQDAYDVLPLSEERLNIILEAARTSAEGVRERVEPGRDEVHATYEVRGFRIGTEIGLLFEDVTQQVKQAAELAQSNQLFLDLYQNAPCGYLTVRPTGEIDRMNMRMREWLGLELEEGAVRTESILTAESSALLLQQIANTGVDSPMHNIELEYVKSDGSTFWGLTNALPLFDAVESSWYWRWTVIDVTERRKVQNELEDNWLFNQLFNELGEAVLISDRSGKIIRANEAAARILGIPVRQLTEMMHHDPAWRAVLEDGTPVPTDQLPGVRALREKRAVGNLELGVVRPDGKLTWILESAAPFFDRNGDISGVIVTFPEVTATVMQRQSLKDLNEKYQIERDRANEANRLKSSFLANMSHEIRTPMTAILGFSDILATELSGKVSEQHYTFLRSINISGKRLLNLINDILDLSKIEAGRLELHLEELDVTGEIDASITPLTWIAKQKGLPIVVQQPDEHWFIRGDRQRFGQVMTNIISNAIKFTRTGSITIRTYITQEDGPGSAKQVNIEIEDTGIGISKDFLPHLFEEFRQEHTGATKEFGGTGLGLAISRRLISLMGGRIHLRSQQGVGTAFTLQFPLISGVRVGKPQTVQTVIQPPVQKEKVHDDAQSGKKLVLVVEDNPETQRLLEVYLKNGYRIAQAFNATEAHAAINREVPDVILMDVNLPGKDGLAITREIRAGSICPKVPIVALTAFAMTGDKQRCLAAGCNAYLSKPATKREVLDKIDQMLRETA